ERRDREGHREAGEGDQVFVRPVFGDLGVPQQRAQARRRAAAEAGRGHAAANRVGELAHLLGAADVGGRPVLLADVLAVDRHQTLASTTAFFKTSSPFWLVALTSATSL